MRDRFAATRGEQRFEIGEQPGRNADDAPSTALRRRHFAMRDRAADADASLREVHVFPAQAERLATACARREEEAQHRRERRLVLVGERQEPHYFIARPRLCFGRFARKSPADAPSQLSDASSGVALDADFALREVEHAAQNGERVADRVEREALGELRFDERE
jgi:hypothetical protein